MTNIEILTKFLEAHIKITQDRVNQVDSILNSYGQNKETFYDALKAIHVIEGRKLKSLSELKEEINLHPESAVFPSS
jgi:ferritin-like metal-binding protein YciE